MPRRPLTSRVIPAGALAVVALLVFFLLLAVIRAGYNAGWTGFGEVPIKETTTTHIAADGSREVDVTKEFQQPRTVWDWMSLMFIPVVGGLAVAGVGYWFNRKQREREEAVEILRAQDEALQAYLDQMSDLLVDRHLRSQPRGTVIHKLAEARTATALLGLDKDHKRRPLKLVYGLDLIKKDKPLLELRNAGLDHADLSELTLRNANLRCADLRVTDLSGADLSGADLSLTDLRGVDLRRADLKDADLTDANLLPYDERDPERLSLHNLRRTDRRIDLSREKLRPRRLMLHPRRLAVTRYGHWWRQQ